MKKKLILIAGMTTAPYLLNSKSSWTDTATADKPGATLGAPVGGVLIPHLCRLATPYGLVGLPELLYTSRSGTRTIKEAITTGREQKKAASSIRANWILDTAASQHSSALVYMDKDNPELKAVIFTDNAGNMRMRLEQEGKYHEIRVEKIEFHTSVSIRPLRHRPGALTRIGVDLTGNEQKETTSGIRKGVGYVPV